ncbi:hypothetical protein [Pseudescherichia sp.]|uniref:hypothetical protein n=1 Tax=Pseudescherichia sp. TaxID=2055881 RepID=UPI0028A05076|nr:hypothetical protein [Pseudescherichia sp.]
MSQLSKLMDQVRPELAPLASHALADRELVVKERYLVLLLASVLEHGALTEQQTRLLEMLLASVQEAQSLVFYIQQAAELDKHALRACLETLRKDKALSNALIFDLLVLLRTAGALADAQMRQLDQLAMLLNMRHEEVYKLVYCCMLLLNGKAEMDSTPCVEHIYAKSSFISMIESKAKAENIVLGNEASFKKPPTSNSWLNSVSTFTSNVALSEITKTEENYIAKKKLTLMKVFPFSVNQLIHGNDFIVRAIRVGVYKRVTFPKGIVIEICKPDWSPFTWSENKNDLVAKVLAFPEGLDAWIPLFDIKDKK